MFIVGYFYSATSSNTWQWLLQCYLLLVVINYLLFDPCLWLQTAPFKATARRTIPKVLPDELSGQWGLPPVCIHGHSHVILPLSSLFVFMKCCTKRQ